MGEEEVNCTTLNCGGELVSYLLIGVLSNVPLVLKVCMIACVQSL